jgi:hypothetical protein
MGISAYKEVTVWNNPEFRVPQNVYLFDGKSNALAYAKESNGEIFIFKKPLPMDTRRRKFEKVKHKALDAIAKTFTISQDAPEGIAVKSDSGKTYYITESNGIYRCSCVGFGYRGKCKHIELAKNQ